MSKKSKQWSVVIPIAGSISISVETDEPIDDKEAIRLAWAAIDTSGKDAGRLEWEFMERIAQGNVLHAPINEIEANPED
jgi:hypothetical protein